MRSNQLNPDNFPLDLRAILEASKGNEEEAFFYLKERLDSFSENNRKFAKDCMDEMCIEMTREWAKKMVASGKKDLAIVNLNEALSKIDRKENGAVLNGLMDILEQELYSPFPYNIIENISEFFISIANAINIFWNKIVSCFRLSQESPSDRIVTNKVAVTKEEEKKQQPVDQIVKSDVGTTADYINKLASSPSLSNLDSKYPSKQNVSEFSDDEDDKDFIESLRNIQIILPPDPSGIMTSGLRK